MEPKNKEVSYYKDGKLEKTKEAECHPLKLAPAAENIKKEWYDVIMEVFSYEKKRGADLQELHKLFLDDRIDVGWSLYKRGNVVKHVKTTVDINATVKSEEDDKLYTVIMKNWLPEKMPRMRYEMIAYIERLFFDCSCEDHTITGHYRSNSALCCKHIAAVMWLLQNEDNMPKFLLRRVEAAQFSKPSELLSKAYGFPMKKFTPYLNVIVLEKFKGMNSSVGISLHRELNEPDRYGKEPYKPTWITFTKPEDVKRIIEALQKGYDLMVAERQTTLIEPPEEQKPSTVMYIYSKILSILRRGRT